MHLDKQHLYALQYNMLLYCTTPARGAGTVFFLWGGGKNVDMPSDCQNRGGHRHIHLIEKKVGGAIATLPPPPLLPRP